MSMREEDCWHSESSPAFVAAARSIFGLNSNCSLPWLIVYTNKENLYHLLHCRLSLASARYSERLCNGLWPP